jgi:hypothetical protein
MAISTFEASVPVLIRAMDNLSAILDKAVASAEARKIDPAVLVAARLAPDMFPLSRQVQIASDTAKRAAAMLAGVEVPSWPDTESTCADLKARVGKTVTFLESFKAEQFDGAEARTIALNVGGGEIKLSGQAFLFNFVLPNLFFHVTVAYAILRHNGVDLGKRDFLGGV